MARNGTSDTLRRHWTLLRLVPRAPRQIDTPRLEQLLDDEGYDVTRRSIQRDLEHLSGSFPGLRCNTKGKPYGWSWDGDAPLLEIPAMGLSAAVTFDLLRSYLTDALPRTTLKTLEPHFTRAREMLATHTVAKLARWPEKVRVLPRGLPLTAPNVPPRVLDVAYTALLEERRFKAKYKPRGATAEKEYVVSPLGIVLRDGTLTLVCTFWDYDNVTSLLLHRMTRAEPLDERVKKPKGFDLDEHLARGGVGFARGGPIALELLVHDVVATTLHETPLGRDQTLTERGKDGRWVVKATVPNSIELRGWLQSYGPKVEVRKPAALRREMAETARELAALYRRKSPRRAR